MVGALRRIPQVEEGKRLTAYRMEVCAHMVGCGKGPQSEEGTRVRACHVECNIK